MIVLVHIVDVCFVEKVIVAQGQSLADAVLVAALIIVKEPFKLKPKKPLYMALGIRDHKMMLFHVSHLIQDEAQGTEVSKGRINLLFESSVVDLS